MRSSTCLMNRKATLLVTTCLGLLADLKFKVDVTVVVCSHEPPLTEDLLQMLGRGQRSSVAYSGRLFCVADAHLGGSIRQRLQERNTFNFFDGAMNLRLINKTFGRFTEKSK